MAVTSHHIENSAQRLPQGRAGFLLTTVLVLWAGLIGLLGYAGTFDVPPSSPAWPTMLAIAVPVGMFLAVAGVSRDFRTVMLGLDPVLLTQMQAWRILGGTFLVVYAFDLLPGLFAWPAGLGDVVVGIAAPFVAMQLRYNTNLLVSRRLRLFHYAGLADFVVAVSAGLATRNAIPGVVESVTSTAMGQMPLVLIPTLIVPIFIIMHLIVLMQSYSGKSER